MRDQAEAHGDDTDDLDEAAHRARRGNQRRRDARQRAAHPAATAAPLDQAAAGRPAAAPPQARPPDSRQDLHRRQTARPSARPCSSPSPARPTGGSLPTGRRPTRTRYDYTRAARDALHFAALFDRFIQNLRRFCGFDLQYFAADRAATTARAARPYRHPRHHLTRGTPRGDRGHLSPGVVAACERRSASTAATCLSGTRTRRPTSTRDSGEVLPTWDEALDAIGDDRRATARRPVR